MAPAAARPEPTATPLHWPVFGTTATLLAPLGGVRRARAAVLPVLDRIDRLASRFRPDSELVRVNRRAGTWTVVSDGFLELVAAALAAADDTSGGVDPTLGAELAGHGYDRDFTQLTPVSRDEPVVLGAGRPARPRRLGSDAVLIDARLPGIRIPPSARLDLGATAKALAADRAARAAHAATGEPILISLGGDIATAGGPPAGGWPVAISADHRDDPADAMQTISLFGGGLATSSLITRRWRHRGRTMHHVLDPRTGEPVTGPWVVASVAAPTCLAANVASTASLVLGDRALTWLAVRGLPARLVAADGTVTITGGWPA
jgi:FAD:protein FMN transferase